MNSTYTRQRLLPLVTILLLTTVAVGANAEDTGYWRASDGALLLNGAGGCWRSGSWTPAQAVAECDPDLMPKTAAAVPPPVARAEPVVVGEKVTIDSHVLFDFDKSEIKPEGREALNEAVRKLNSAGPGFQLVVSTGHADSTGSTAYNTDLSQRRADAVKDYLVSNGVDSSDIKTIGMGESNPSADNATAEGRAENRRVEIRMTSTAK